MVLHGLQNGGSIFFRVAYTAVLTLCSGWAKIVNVASRIQPEASVENMEGENIGVLDFKLSPCFESCMYSFGYFPGVRLWFADVWM